MKTIYKASFMWPAIKRAQIKMMVSICKASFEKPGFKATKITYSNRISIDQSFQKQFLRTLNKLE